MSQSLRLSVLGLVISMRVAAAQTTGVIAGRVVDSTSGQPLAGATAAVIATGQVVSVGVDGRFLMARVPIGSQTLRVRALGYRIDNRRVSVLDGDTTRVDVRLVPVPHDIGAVRIDAPPSEREGFEARPNVGVVVLTARAIQGVPRLGEADIVRAAQLAPGVEARNDYSTGFNVHGGESDQNLILIDNYPIYNPFHLGGLFSTFIGSTVSDVQLLTGSIPAQYGGRLSSVLDVHSAEEPRSGIHGGVDASVLAATGTAGGSIANGRGSWMIAGRRTYADRVIQWFSDERIPYHFRDEQAHLTYRLSPSTRLAVTVYDGRDVLDGSFAEASTDTVRHDAAGGAFLFTWGNLVAGTTLTQSLGPSTLFGWRLGDSARLEQRLSTSRFSTTIDLGSGASSFTSSLSDDKLGGSFATFGRRHDRTFGYELSEYDIRYATAASRASLDTVRTRQRPRVGALYFDDLWRVRPSLLIQGGVRLESMFSGLWSGVSPRVSAKYLTSPTSALTAAVGRYSQWTHSMTLEDDPILLFDYWRASDANTPVSTVWQFVLGHERWLDTYRSVRIEAFHKRYDRLLEGNPQSDPAIDGDEFVESRGVSYGADFTLRQYEAGPFSGWLTYTYAVSTRQHDSVRYVPAQDRRHNLNIVGSWHLAKFTASARIGYGSGIPYTEATGALPRRHFDPVRGTWGTGGDRATFEDMGGTRNGARFPATKRVDVQVQRSFRVRGASLSPYVSVVNVTNAHNVLFYLYDFARSPAERTTVGQFALLPSAGLSIVF